MAPTTTASRIRRLTFHRLVAEGLPPGLAADDGCGLHFRNGSLHRAVASRPGARVYRVELLNGGVEETPLDVTFLG